jgi:hypothetical protein
LLAKLQRIAVLGINYAAKREDFAIGRRYKKKDSF